MLLTFGWSRLPIIFYFVIIDGRNNYSVAKNIKIRRDITFTFSQENIDLSYMLKFDGYYLFILIMRLVDESGIAV